MKTKKGCPNYKLPKMGEIVDCRVKGRDYDVQLCRVARENLPMTDMIGFPSMFAIDRINNMIMFWPVPDRIHDIRVRYYPPVKEF